MEKREKKSHESRERILKEAVRLFARRGYGSTGLRELAAAAQVNLAMISYFFGSKKGLLREILDTFLSGYLTVAKDTLGGLGGPEEKLHRFVLAAIDYFSRNPDGLIVTITELPRDDPDIIAYKATWGKQMMEIIDREICSRMEVVGTGPVQASLLGPLLLSMMASRFILEPVVSRVGEDRGDPPADQDEYARVLAALVLHGLRPLPEAR